MRVYAKTVILVNFHVELGRDDVLRRHLSRVWQDAKARVVCI